MNTAINILEDTLKRIEGNLFGENSLGSIANSVHVTKYHLLRLFKRVTGCGITEYINLRRLSSSLIMLTSSRADIGYVANAHGYATSQAYSKAFRRAFGMPPSAYRKSPVELKICDPFNIELVRSCKGGVLILPDIKLMPAFSLAGIRHKIRAKDNIYRAVGMRHAIDFFFTESKSIRKPVSRGKYFGLGLSPEYFTEITEDEQYVFYMPSLLVDENSVIPDGMVRAYLPARKYAQFKYTGMHNVLDTGGDVFYDIWDYILFKWLPTVRYKEDGHCCFEYIDTARCSDDYCEIDFYLSICE